MPSAKWLQLGFFEESREGQYDWILDEKILSQDKVGEVGRGRSHGTLLPWQHVWLLF